jgi:hypothetical protein
VLGNLIRILNCTGLLEEYWAIFDCHNDNHMLSLIFNCTLQHVGEYHTTKNFPVQNFISSLLRNTEYIKICLSYS